MPITRLVNRDETPTRQIDLRGQATGVIETHALRVLEVGSTYWGDGDSAYHAVVLRDDGGHEMVGYCSTYCPGAHGICEAVVDAPEEALEAYLEEKRRTGEANSLSIGSSRADAVWHTARKGALVRVVAGRKLPVGLEGRVFWSGDSRFGTRVGISPNDGSEGVFTAHTNIEVLEQPELGADPCGRAYDLPDPYLPGRNRPEPSAPLELPALLPARPVFTQTRLAMLRAGDDPVRYWGWAVAPYPVETAGRVEHYFALHLQGQSNWSVVRAQAKAFQATDPETLLAWLTRRSALPEADYLPAPIPAFCDPRSSAGARFLVETSHATLAEPTGVSVELPATE